MINKIWLINTLNIIVYISKLIAYIPIIIAYNRYKEDNT